MSEKNFIIELVVSRETIHDRFSTGNTSVPKAIEKYGSELISDISIDGLVVTLKVCSETKEISENIANEVFDDLQKTKEQYLKQGNIKIVSITKNYS